MTETRAVRIVGFYCKFRCKSDPEKRRTFTLKMHVWFGTWKNDSANRMIQLSVSQLSGVYCTISRRIVTPMLRPINKRFYVHVFFSYRNQRLTQNCNFFYCLQQRKR